MYGEDYNVQTIARKVFLLSAYELCLNNDRTLAFNVEGTKIPYYNTQANRIVRYNGKAAEYWTRSNANDHNRYTFTITDVGYYESRDVGSSSASYGVVPTFLLPSTLWVNDDGSVTTNTSPTISGSNQNLGNKNANFNITYSVNDVNTSDALTITEKRDSTTIRTINNATRNLTYTIPITITGVTLGAHTVTITVSDGKGGTATRTYTFTRVNAAPTISGSDQNLGSKNKGFVLTYRVADADNDALTVTEKLNGTVLQTINNAPKNTDITLELSDAQVYALDLDSQNTVTIQAQDPNGGVAYRNYTFTRVNAAPTISGEDETLGTVEEPFFRDYIISDVEGDVVTVTELVDDATIRTFEAVHGETNTITLPMENWRILPNGQHTLKVEAVDAKGAKSVRLFQFSKNETSILFTLAAPIAADAQPKKILISPIWSIAGGTATVEACNNAFDEAPTWEDITAQVLVNRHFNFINTTKTAEQWGINVRFTIDKNDGFEGEISVNGFGGAFE
ncbi:hypothetical protein EDD78_10694 [Harryflintia acetispora]|uniref:DUF6273 domain-containing protein n=1 Tax=Harryflintia acetispora TaxID=1849041 RepID=A0A9X8Y896_9FIRM|nr:hypothetical protein EDD78_10694 [Harryflintia acetispora]